MDSDEFARLSDEEKENVSPKPVWIVTSGYSVSCKGALITLVNLRFGCDAQRPAT